MDLCLGVSEHEKLTHVHNHSLVTHKHIKAKLFKKKKNNIVDYNLTGDTQLHTFTQVEQVI